MFDLKDSCVYEKGCHTQIYIFTRDGFGEVNVMKIVNENFVQ